MKQQINGVLWYIGCLIDSFGQGNNHINYKPFFFKVKTGGSIEESCGIIALTCSTSSLKERSLSSLRAGDNGAEDSEAEDALVGNVGSFGNVSTGGSTTSDGPTGIKIYIVRITLG